MSQGHADWRDEPRVRQLLSVVRGDPALCARVEESLGHIARALADCGREQAIFSFNGGKDSVVVLELLCAVLGADDAPGVRLVRWRRHGDFAAVTEFVAALCAERSLTPLEFAPTTTFADGLRQVPECAVVFMGQRRGDPGTTTLSVRAMTSAGYPPVLRVNPILEWSYADVWAFLDAVGARVCPLYADGYTSLGAEADTQQNAVLKRADGTYAHARELVDGSLERAGRSK